MSNKKQIFSSRCWLEGKLQPATITFEQGIICEISSTKSVDAEDVGDNILMPGIIDAHVHINEPGRTEWEGFDTITQAAAAGGITTIIDMPLNASPVTTSQSAFHTKLESSRHKLNVNVGFYGGLVPGNINEIEALIKAGVIGVKCFLTHSGIDEFPNVTEKELDEAMPILAKYRIPLLVHAELESPVKDELSANPYSYAAYLSSRPKKWENDAIALMINLCRKHLCPVHIVHVSSAEALSLIEQARKEGLPLTAETCAQYIYFNSENIPDGQPVYKCAPPIRESANNHQLKLALQSGVLDFIATDHSPAPPEIKELQTGNLQKAWGGIAGIQFLLPAAYTALKDMIPLEAFIPLITEHPAKFIGAEKRKGILKVGYDADLVVWNPEAVQVVKEEDILFRHRISPYIRESMYGKVLQTIVNGETVYQNQKITHKNQGQWLYRQ